MGRDGRVAQELVEVKAHRKRGQALHVGAVDELVSANHVGLEGREGPRLRGQPQAEEFSLLKSKE